MHLFICEKVEESETRQIVQFFLVVRNWHEFQFHSVVTVNLVMDLVLMTRAD